MILGLCGEAGAGKDTFADTLVQDHGFVKVSMADPMKRFCRDVFNFTDAQMWGVSHARNEPDTRFERKPAKRGKIAQHLTPRLALQLLGTEWGRFCWRDIWIAYAVRVALAIVAGTRYSAKLGLNPYVGNTSPNIVIPDVRYQNEIDVIRGAGGKIIRIDRPHPPGFWRAVRRWFAERFSWRAHSSEKLARSRDKSLFDEIYLNAGTIDDMRREIAESVAQAKQVIAEAKKQFDGVAIQARTK